MNFEFLFTSVEGIDGWPTDLFDGTPLLAALGIACIVGLRHASDPDHLVAVTSLVAADDGDTRQATRLGVMWGAGHASTLVLLGFPLIFLKSELPSWLESGAETAVGVVILLLALRVLLKWARGDFRMAAHTHDHPAATDAAHPSTRRHLRRGAGTSHRHVLIRTPQQALGIGMLHGLAGTGAVVLLLLAALPSQAETAAALAVFAPMSVLSMAACTTTFAWLLTRPAIDPVYRTLLIPALGAFGVLFGLGYTGLI